MLGVYIVYIIVILLIIRMVSKGGKEGYAGCPKKHNLRMKKIFIENYKRELETMSVPMLKRLAIEVGIPKKVYYAEEKSKKNLISIIFKHKYKQDYTPSLDFSKKEDIQKKETTGEEEEPSSQKKKRVVQMYSEENVYYADPYDLETTNEKKRNQEAGGETNMVGASHLERNIEDEIGDDDDDDGN